MPAGEPPRGRRACSPGRTPSSCSAGTAPSCGPRAPSPTSTCPSWASTWARSASSPRPSTRTSKRSWASSRPVTTSWSLASCWRRASSPAGRRSRAARSTSPSTKPPIVRGALARVMRVVVDVGDSRVASYVCDGVVVASPTGSTGYSFSAGGPIIEPTSRNLVVTPIAAYLTPLRSSVVGPQHVVSVKVEAAHDCPRQHRRAGGYPAPASGTGSRSGLDRSPSTSSSRAAHCPSGTCCARRPRCCRPDPSGRACRAPPPSDPAGGARPTCSRPSTPTPTTCAWSVVWLRPPSAPTTPTCGSSAATLRASRPLGLLAEPARHYLGAMTGHLALLRPTSLRRKAASIRAFYRFCYAEELIETDVAALIDLPRQMQRLPDTLDAREVSRAARRDRWPGRRRVVATAPSSSCSTRRDCASARRSALIAGTSRSPVASCASSARATRNVSCRSATWPWLRSVAYLDERDRLAQTATQSGARNSARRRGGPGQEPLFRSQSRPAPGPHGSLAGHARRGTAGPVSPGV